MKTPRLLPLAGIAIGGVLALKLLSGVTELPQMLQGAKAFAEGVVPAKTADLGKGKDAAGADAPKSDAPPLPPGFAAGKPGAAPLIASADPNAQPRLACGPNSADLAREAGLSPAELQVLQSLGTRRGQLDTREQDLDVQLQLLSVAGSKLDAKLAALQALKADIQKLVDNSDQQTNAEIDRLVIVYSQMNPKAAAARFSLLDDSVRLPIAAKMKERNLSAILAQMAPPDARVVTEKLAQRYQSKALADARSAINAAPPATAPATPAPAQAAQTTPPAAGAAPAAPGDQQAAAAKPKKLAKAGPSRRRGAKARALAANARAAKRAPAEAADAGAAAPAPAAAAKAG